MKNLILGLGNPILSDDGVGLLLARKLEKLLDGVQVATTELVGLALLDHLAGFDRVFVVDACNTGQAAPGELVNLLEGDGACHLFSSHGLDFWEILRLGQAIGLKMPEVGAIYGIEIGQEVAFGDEPSEEIRDRLDDLAEAIAQDMAPRIERNTQTGLA